MKTKYSLLTVAMLCFGLLAGSLHAQQIAVTSTNLSEALQIIGLSPLANSTLLKPGVPFTFNNQTFLITDNTNGTYTVATSGPAGSASITPPTTVTGAIQTGQSWLAANNPDNIGFYGTNELDFRVGTGYLQNSGKAVAALSAQKYGLGGYSNMGVGVGVLQGNNGSKPGTAAAYGELDYRKPIGDVAAVGGVIGGYDEWNKEPFGGVKGGLEYRHSSHIGAWLDVTYSFENSHSDDGLGIFGGVGYSF